MSRANATYVYCLVRSAAPPSLGGGPEGLPGTAAPRLLPLDGDLWLVVADAPLSEYSGAEIESRLSDLSWVTDRALAHEAVVEHCAAAGPVLPMKLFTLFREDERAVAHLRGQRQEIDQTLDRIAGRVEWGVRILFREDEARRKAVASIGDGPRSSVSGSSGTSFLLRKKAEKESARDLAASLRAEVDQAYEELASRASEARRRAPETSEVGARLLLDAAFLVPSGEAETFDAAVQRLAERLGERSCEVTLTGPWPPYNFLGDPA